MQTHRFEAEVDQILELVIHSLYAHKEIFLRELVSNASDALDKLRFEALKRPELLTEGEVLGIAIETDTKARTLRVADNGIGMTEEELVENLGRIASSGYAPLPRAAREARKRERSRAHRPLRRGFLFRVHGRRRDRRWRRARRARAKAGAGPRADRVDTRSRTPRISRAAPS
jgi:hypothetical protein